MLSTSLPSAVFVADGVAADLIRPRAERQRRDAVPQPVTSQITHHSAEAPRWLTRLRQARATTY